MTDEQKQIRKELVEMICAMNEQQFAWFCEKVMEVLTPDERDFYEKTCKITTERE
jgi:UDP-glucose 6-dehydrogenase